MADDLIDLPDRIVTFKFRVTNLFVVILLSLWLWLETFENKPANQQMIAQVSSKGSLLFAHFHYC